MQEPASSPTSLDQASISRQDPGPRAGRGGLHKQNRPLLPTAVPGLYNSAHAMGAATRSCYWRQRQGRSLFGPFHHGIVGMDPDPRGHDGAVVRSRA